MSLTKLKLIQILFFWGLLSIAPTNAQNQKVDSLEKVLKSHIQTDTSRVNILNEIAYSLYNQDATKAEAYATQSGKISNQIHYLKGKATSLWIIGLTSLKKDKKKALQYFQKALNMGKKAGDKDGICNYLISIGNLTMELGDIKKSNDLFNKTVQIAKQIDNKKLIIKALYNISRSQTREGCYPEAIKQLHEIVNIANEINDKQMLSKTYGQLAFIYTRQGSYPVGIEFYLSALKINEEINDQSGIFYNLINISEIQSKQKDYKLALQTIQKAFQVSKMIDDSLKMSMCLINTGNIYLHTNNEMALKSFQEALTLVKDNDINQRIIILTQIGTIHTEQKEFNKALKEFEEALALAYKIKQKPTYGEVWRKIGILFYAQKQYNQAISYTQKALHLAEELKLLELQKNSYKLLSELYAATGSFNEAYWSQKKYKALDDSIFNEKNIRQIAFLESAYAYDKERQRHEMEKEKHKMEIKNQRLIILFLVTVSLLSLLLVFTVYRSNKLKKKLLRLEIENINRELEENQKAVTATTLKLVQNTERNAHYIKTLENIKKNTLEEGQNEIRSLLADYKFNSNNSNWEEFEVLFQKVDSSFYEKLSKYCPTLTPNERKLCVFLKLNMSNKHISQITFQSEEALKKARLRLRKKLELDHDTNLTTFIQNL